MRSVDRSRDREIGAGSHPSPAKSPEIALLDTEAGQDFVHRSSYEPQGWPWRLGAVERGEAAREPDRKITSCRAGVSTSDQGRTAARAMGRVGRRPE